VLVIQPYFLTCQYNVIFITQMASHAYVNSSASRGSTVRQQPITAADICIAPARTDAQDNQILCKVHELRLPHGTLTCTDPDWTNNVVILQSLVVVDIAKGQLAQVTWIIPDGASSREG
jgi:hypothetical protein